MKITEFQGKYRFLSNFWEAPVTYEGINYLNNEAAFQSAKLKQVEKRTSFSHLEPSDAKKKGFHVPLRADWEQVKEQIMYEIVLAKFIQNDDLRKKLIATGDAELIEGNTWNDREWGVCRGSGKNKLGRILMRVREELSK